MELNKKYFKYLLLILIIFNIISLFNNFALKSEILKLNSIIYKNGNQSVAKYSPKNLIFLKDTVRSSDPLSLIVFFSENGCPLCLKYELPNLEQLYNDYRNNVSAYFIGSKESYFSGINIKFPIKEVDSAQTIVNDPAFTVVNPIALLVDSSGMVQYIYFAEPGNEKKSNQFYQRMHSLFKSIQSASSSLETASK